MAGKVRPPGIIMCPALERLNPSLTIHPAKSADLFGVLTATGAAPRPGTRKGKPRGFAVAITDLPLFSMLRTRMQWHQERQRLLAQNVANADTRNYRPQDLAPLRFEPSKTVTTATTGPGAMAGLLRPHSRHIGFAASSSGSRFQADAGGGYETRPGGNAVNLEDEMIKVAANQMDFQAATTLYTKSLGLLKAAIGKR